MKIISYHGNYTMIGWTKLFYLREIGNGFGLRVGPFYVRVKRTSNELFSERHGYQLVFRHYSGWSVVFRHPEFLP